MFITILCIVMGITLLIFFLYHLKMVGSGLTTNERIKKSDIINILEKEIKKIKNIPKNEKIDEKEKIKLEKKIEVYKRDLVTLRNFKSKGFIYNLKEIIMA